MSKHAPIEIVGIEDAVKAGGTPVLEKGTMFCFNNLQVLKFKDGTSYHAKTQRVTISDEKLIANLIEASKNRGNHIFIES